MAIVIVGLGAGGGEMLTRQAWWVFEEAEVVYLRTERHPAGSALPSHLTIHSFDHIYEQAEQFSDVYEKIAETIVQLGKSKDVVYAVPGHPHIGESTVTAIMDLAEQSGVNVTIVPGVSFIEPVLSAVGVDGLAGLQLFDGIELAEFLHPPISPDTPLLIGQVYSRLLASELKMALMAIYSEEHEVALVHSAGNVNEVVEWVDLYEIDHSERIDHLTTLFVPPLARPSSLAGVAELVAYLRSPAGCPWDQKQTSQSIRPGLLEEASEVLEAIDTEDMASLQEELGDLLFHIVFQAQMASEDDIFRLSDVVAGVYAKLKRRHPHVWGDWAVENSDQVEVNWETLKQMEKGEQQVTSILANVPVALPALARAQKIQGKVKKVGFDWPDVIGVVEKVREEIEEVLEESDPAGQADEIGDLLFAVVNWARWLGVDAEIALREANLRFTRRFQQVEQLAEARVLDLPKLTIDELEALWQEVKVTSNR